jgi:hypothetical protein
MPELVMHTPAALGVRCTVCGASVDALHTDYPPFDPDTEYRPPRHWVTPCLHEGGTTAVAPEADA